LSDGTLATARGLSKRYRTSAGLVEALSGLDLEVERGHLTAVVGPSGSGKSTLLKIVAGLERPSGGEIDVEGHDLSGLRGRELRGYRRDTVTYVSQSPADNFLPQLTLDQHVELLRRPSGRARELLARFGLADRSGEYPRSLSGGEQARAAFALALLRDRPLIVADEPSAELDEEAAAALLTALKAAADAGASFLIATHDAAVTAVADSTVRLERGRRADAAPSAPPLSRTHSADEPAEPVLVASRVSKDYPGRGGTVHAVRAAGLELPKGSFGVVVGRSGSGKSTLLSLLGRWQQPDEGTIDYAGESPERRAPDWQTVGYVPQRFGLVPELTVSGNVELGARARGTLAAERAAIRALLRELRLDEVADRQPHETSIGQQQRTALARALVGHPRILLADEPTSHQDLEGRSAILDLLLERTANGMTCLLATHEDAVAALGRPLWEMTDGRLTVRGG
jgi:ABC-type lipoprotein export system ATPase subunit